MSDTPTQATELLIAIIFISLCCIIALYITAHAIYQLFVLDSSSWINKTYRNLTIIIMVLFTLSSFSDLVHSVLRYMITNISEHASLINAIVTDSIYFTGNIMFYTLILLRMPLPFQLNKCVIYTLSVIIFMSAISSFLYCIWIPVSHDYDIPEKYWKIILIVLSADDFILNSLILIIFAHKMSKTVANIDPTMSIQAKNNVNLINNVMVKHGILFGIAIIMNQGFFACHLYESYHYGFLIKVCITYSVRGVENLTNIIVLWLVLRINYDRYICVCKCCHICVAKGCLKAATKSKKSLLENPYNYRQL